MNFADSSVFLTVDETLDAGESEGGRTGLPPKRAGRSQPLTDAKRLDAG